MHLPQQPTLDFLAVKFFWIKKGVAVCVGHTVGLQWAYTIVVGALLDAKTMATALPKECPFLGPCSSGILI